MVAQDTSQFAFVRLPSVIGWGGTLSTDFEVSTGRYLDELRNGGTVASAVDSAHLVVHKDEVQAAAVRMLEDTGVIDMKRLAVESGISRASLYRYYPDKLAVESEIAAALAVKMGKAAAHHSDFGAKLRAAVEVLFDDPAGCAALGPVVAAVGADVLAESAKAIVGHPAAAPMLVGYGALAASAHRRGEIDSVRRMLERTMKQFELSLT